MRRHHRLTLHELAPPADSIALILGAEAVERARWQSSSQAGSPGVSSPTQALQYPSDRGDESKISKTSDAGAEGEGPEEDRSPSFLGREDSYARLHTQTPHSTPLPRQPVLRVPSYSKTIHAFTLNQLHHSLRNTKSAASSPRLSAKHPPHLPLALPVLAAKLDADELEAITSDEQPCAPVNTPDGHSEHQQQRFYLERVWERSYRVGEVQGIDFRKLKRSWTEPHQVGRSLVVG